MLIWNLNFFDFWDTQSSAQLVWWQLIFELTVIAYKTDVKEVVLIVQLISLIINSYPKKFCFNNILINVNWFNSYWLPCYRVTTFKHCKPRLNNNLILCWKSKHYNLVSHWVWSFQNRVYVNNIQYRVATAEVIKLT